MATMHRIRIKFNFSHPRSSPSLRRINPVNHTLGDKLSKLRAMDVRGAEMDDLRAEGYYFRPADTKPGAIANKDQFLTPKKSSSRAYGQLTLDTTPTKAPDRLSPAAIARQLSTTSFHRTCLCSPHDGYTLAGVSNWSPDKVGSLHDSAMSEYGESEQSQSPVKRPNFYPPRTSSLQHGTTPPRSIHTSPTKTPSQARLQAAAQSRHELQFAKFKIASLPMEDRSNMERAAEEAHLARGMHPDRYDADHAETCTATQKIAVAGRIGSIVTTRVIKDES